MFYRAADWGVHEGPNPAKKIRFYRESPAPRLLTAGEVARIIEAAEALRVKPKSQTQRVFADLVRMAVNTGLRKSELLKLRWADVRDEGLTIKGKGEKTRAVPLNAEAQVVLERQSRRDPYVFGLSGGHRGSLFRRTVDTIRKATDIDWHFHLLRHYFSSTLLARGVDIVTVSDLLGHARVTTSLLYSHTTAERKRAAVTNLDTRARDVEPEKPRKLLKRKVPLA
jgi:integrase